MVNGIFGSLLLWGLISMVSCMPESFINTNIDTFLDLTNTAILRSNSTITVKPVKDGTGYKEYYFALPYASTKAFVGVRQLLDSRSLILKVVKDKADGDLQYYHTLLPINSDLTIQISTVYTHPFRYLPKSIEQATPKNIAQGSYKQYLLLKGWNVVGLTSPYKIERVKTSVRFPNSDIKSYTQSHSPVSRSTSSLTFGPYSALPALADKKVDIHYGSPNAAFVARTLKRTIGVGQLSGLLHVQEEWELVNDGAPLKGHFSRIDLMSTQRIIGDTNIIPSISLALPANAANPYFKDYNGNVSSTNFRSNQKSSTLEFRPRYPLFGGWKYTWFFGYEVPLTTYLTQKGDERWEVRVPVYSGVKNWTVDALELEVRLPEGAMDINVELPFDAKWSIEKRFSYFDTIGEPTVVFKWKNVVDEYAVDFTVSYKYPKYMMLLKPGVIILGFLSFVGVIFLGSLIDLSIVKKIKNKKKAE